MLGPNFPILEPMFANSEFRNIAVRRSGKPNSVNQTVSGPNICSSDVIVSVFARAGLMFELQVFNAYTARVVR